MASAPRIPASRALSLRNWAGLGVLVYVASGFGLRLEGLRFRVSGSGLRVQGLGFRA